MKIYTNPAMLLDLIQPRETPEQALSRAVMTFGRAKPQPTYGIKPVAPYLAPDTAAAIMRRHRAPVVKTPNCRIP